MHKKYIKKSSPTSWLHSQLAATSALIKFCEDHEYLTNDMNHLRACEEALINKSINKAIDEYNKIPLGGNGCFNDWYPTVKYEHETAEYLKVVFESLVAHWSRLIQLSIEAQNA